MWWMAASLYSQNQQAQKQDSICTSHTPIWNAALVCCSSHTQVSYLLLLCCRIALTQNPSVLWAVLDPAELSPAQGGANALRAARASGSCGCVFQQHAARDRHCWAVPCWSPSPSLLCSSGWVLQGTALSLCPWTLAGLSSTVKVHFGGNTLPLPFLKHRTVPYEAAKQVWGKSNAVL